MIIGGESGDVNVPSQVFGFVYGGKYKNTFVNLKRSLGIGAEGDYSCFDGQAFSVDTLEFWAQKGSGFGPKQLNHLVKTIHADDLSCYEILSQSGGVDDGQIVSCITVQLFYKDGESSVLEIQERKFTPGRSQKGEIGDQVCNSWVAQFLGMLAGVPRLGAGGSAGSAGGCPSSLACATPSKAEGMALALESLLSKHPATLDMIHASLEGKFDKKVIEGWLADLVSYEVVRKDGSFYDLVDEDGAKLFLKEQKR